MDKSEKVWDRLAIMFDKADKGFEKTRSKTVEYTEDYLQANAIVLDFGCATGTIAAEIADKVKEVHGIDISSKMINAAKSKAAAHNIKNIYFSQSTIFDEGLQKESFDVVLAFNVLHFFEDVESVIKRINELLKPGGMFLSVIPCKEHRSLSSVSLLLLSRIIGIPYMRFFRVSEFESSLTTGGYQIIATKSLTSSEYYIAAKKLNTHWTYK